MDNFRCFLLKAIWRFKEDRLRSIILTSIPPVVWTLLLGLVELIASASGKPTDQWLRERGFPSVITLILVGGGIMMLLMIAIVALMVLTRNSDLEAIRPYFDALTIEQKNILRRVLPLGSVSANLISSTERDDLEGIYQTCRFVIRQDAHYIVDKDKASRLALLLRCDEIKQKHWHQTPENELTSGLTKPKGQLSAPKKPKPEPSIILAGQPRHTFVILDKNYVFHENRVSPKKRRALVIDFRNELEQGKEIKSLESVKTQLTYNYGPGPWLSERVNRGFWLDHEYTHTDFQRGDTRTLLIGILFSDHDGRDALQVYDNNKRESENDPIQQPGTVTFGKYDSLTIKVALFTQTRHRFHKECEFELDKDGRCQITKPFA